MDKLHKVSFRVFQQIVAYMPVTCISGRRGIGKTTETISRIRKRFSECETSMPDVRVVIECDRTEGDYLRHLPCTLVTNDPSMFSALQNRHGTEAFGPSISIDRMSLSFNNEPVVDQRFLKDYIVQVGAVLDLILYYTARGS
jgi:hypothetical protein